MSAARRPGREVELSLVIVSPDPEAVLRRIARLRKIGPYELRPRGTARIVDRYLDTAKGDLRRRRLALRLRDVGGTTLIAVKGPRRSASTRTEDRLEREQPFSPEAAAAIGRLIGIRQRRSADEAPSNDPADLLRLLFGVRVIQRRETSRRLRDVVDGEDRRVVLAELALDRVQFRFDDTELRHYEIEVEAKRTGRGTRAIRSIPAELLARYPDELADWPYGKLPTGRAIEQLVRKGKLEALGPGGTLTAEAYEQIRRYLRRTG